MLSVLSDTEKLFLKEAEDFVNAEIRPLATEIDRSGVYPKALISKLANLKLLSSTLPQLYGGIGLSQTGYGYLTEIIGKVCQATRALLTVHSSLVSETIATYGNEEQKAKWLLPLSKGEMIGAFALTEPETGTDAKSISTTYRSTSDSYILNGKKKWITFSGIADVLIVIAKAEEKVSAFLVPTATEGVTITPMQGLLAARGAHVAQISLEDVVIPKANLLAAEGGGFAYIVSSALDSGRYSIAWGGVGIAQAALESMVTYSRKRKQFDKKIYEFQLIQGLLGDTVTQVHAARALCEKASALRDKKHSDAVTETSLAKYFASQVAVKAASDAVQVHGGNGCWDEYPVERLYREAKILEIIEGTNQIQQKLAATYALRTNFVKGLYKY